MNNHVIRAVPVVEIRREFEKERKKAGEIYKKVSTEEYNGISPELFMFIKTKAKIEAYGRLIFDEEERKELKIILKEELNNAKNK